MPEETVENVAFVIATYPHFSGRKGQGYMIYHCLGYIGMNAYDTVKKNIKRILVQEASGRDLIPSRTTYEHIRPETVGEICAEDFTDLIVDSQTFKLAILIDVYDQYKMGVTVGRRATAALVNETVKQALAENDGMDRKSSFSVITVDSISAMNMVKSWMPPRSCSVVYPLALPNIMDGLNVRTRSSKTFFTMYSSARKGRMRIKEKTYWKE